MELDPILNDGLNLLVGGCSRSSRSGIEGKNAGNGRRSGPNTTGSDLGTTRGVGGLETVVLGAAGSGSGTVASLGVGSIGSKLGPMSSNTFVRGRG